MLKKSENLKERIAKISLLLKVNIQLKERSIAVCILEYIIKIPHNYNPTIIIKLYN